MKLVTAKITEFQSIRDSNEFEIGNITCLVGKNEAGKTAILRALYRINPIIPDAGNFDVTDDYPRSDVEDYRQDVESGKKTPAIVVKAVFNLEPIEIKNINEDFGVDIFEKTELIITKGYNNKQYIQLFLNSSRIINKILEQGQLPEDLIKKLSVANSLESLNNKIKELITPETEEHLSRLNLILQEINAKQSFIIYFYDRYLIRLLPKFMYFDEFFIMSGAENIDELKKRVEQNKLCNSDYPLLGLIELARLNLDQLLSPESTEDLINKLEGASNHLSKQVLKYWSQNKHISMKFDVRPGKSGDPNGMQSGTNIWARVHDSRRQVSTLLGSRSRGFVWFFSFLAWFDQQKKKNEPLILLLDEPGLFLHGRAQADLLRYLETELSQNHQVIYTTHSPFMVDSKKFDRVRIVQDRSTDEDGIIPKEQDGTKVITEVLDATEDSLFPLQGALGYDIYQSLFIGPYSLVVEGASDLLFLQIISGYLSSQKRTSLDERWTITPVGGAGKVPAYVSMIGSQKGMVVATLIDIDNKNQQKIDDLFKKKLLSKRNVLTFNEFTKTAEADIEDMFGEDFYLDLINHEYSSELLKPMSLGEISKKPGRILKKIENYLKENPLSSGNQFNHYRQARFLSEHPDLLSKIPEEALGRFEGAFNKLNILITN
ncbi:MAG: ATP-binding protein [Proteobacteria bacterium]|nr:ATP-binding protein [Pseudomonadota bacterium]